MHRVEANGSGYTCMYGAVSLRTGTDDVATAAFVA